MELSEKEAKLMLAPLAAAIMLSSDEIKESMKVEDGKAYEPWKVVRQYESFIDMLYSSYQAIH